MYCQNCGSQNDNANAFCIKCGARIGAGATQATQVAKGEVKNHKIGAIVLLIISIVMTLGIPIPFVLLLPFGIITMVKSCKVNPRLAQGDVVGAQEASKKAKYWVKLTSVLIGVLIALFIISFALVPAVKRASQAAKAAQAERQQYQEQNNNY